MNNSPLLVKDITTEQDWRAPLPDAFNISTIHMMEKEQLLSLQKLAGWGADWGTIDTPAERLPKGTSRRTAVRIISVNTLCSPGPELELAQLTFTRFALLLYFGKAHKFSGFLKAGTINSELSRMKMVLATAITKPTIPQGGMVARLSDADLHGRRGETVEDSFGKVINRLRWFRNKGWWLDVPLEKAFTAVEPHLDTAKNILIVSKRRGDGHQPLPDEFVSQAGWRLIWIMENLGPALLACGQQLAAIRSEIAQRATARGVMQQHTNKLLSKASQSFLSNYDWRTPAGQKIDSLPFAIHIGHGRKKTDGSRIEYSWPPSHFFIVDQLLQILQDAHMFMFLLASGGRISECLSLNENCIVSDNPDQEFIAGRTYKLVHQEGGKLRDWPVPAIVLKAIQQQIKLHKAIISLGDEFGNRSAQDKATGIWVTGTGGEAQGSVSLRFCVTFKQLGLTHLLQGDTANPHRFRKTLARLCALVLFGAPKILMDLFGHKDIAMTLHYINTDPLLRAEMIQIARDITIMYAKDAINNINNYGGPAASKLSAAIQQEKVRLGGHMGADDMQRCAEILTDNGSLWRLVRPGVLCTKSPTASGPCTKARGIPDPAHCQTACDDRLEQAFLRDDVDRSIEQAVSYLVQAYVDGDEYKSEEWEGQVLALLPRFSDIKKKWSLHPVVAPLVAKGAEVA